MPDAKQWEEALRTEMKQLERLGVFNAPCKLSYGAKKIRTGQSSRRNVLTLERWSAGRRGWWPKDSFRHLMLTSSTRMPQVSRIIYALSVYLNLFIESMDVDLALLNATLKERRCLHRPTGWIPSRGQGSGPATQQGTVWAEAVA